MVVVVGQRGFLLVAIWANMAFPLPWSLSPFYSRQISPYNQQNARTTYLHAHSGRRESQKGEMNTKDRLLAKISQTTNASKHQSQLERRADTRASKRGMSLRGRSVSRGSGEAEYRRAMSILRSRDWQSALRMLITYRNSSSPYASRLAHSLLNFLTTHGSSLGAARRDTTASIISSVFGSGIAMDTQVWTSSLLAQVSAGEWKSAIRSYNLGKIAGFQPGLPAYGAALSAMRMGAQWKRALDLGWKVVRENPVVPDARFFATFLGAILKREDRRAALRALEIHKEMRRLRVRGDLAVYKTLIGGITQADGSMAPMALGLYHEMTKEYGISPDVPLLRMMIGVCSKRRARPYHLWHKALVFYIEVLKRDPLALDSVSYSAAIAAAEAGGRWEAALDIYETQRGRSVRVLDVAYTNLIIATSRVGRYQKALEVLDDMVEHGVIPDVVGYSAAIGGCMKGFRFDLAGTLLEEMHAIGIDPTPITHRFMCECLLDAEERESHYETSFQRLNLAKNLAKVEGEGIPWHSYGSALFSTLLLGRWKMGRVLFKEWEKSQTPLHPMVWHIIIAACCERGTYNWESVDMFKSLFRANVTVDTRTGTRMAAVVSLLRDMIRYNPDESKATSPEERRKARSRNKKMAKRHRDLFAPWKDALNSTDASDND
ncbi:hypothetical protein AAMO2058_000945600 [Amorphochlora amoebiformis]